jgi:hypothetical protein
MPPTHEGEVLARLDQLAAALEETNRRLLALERPVRDSAVPAPAPAGPGPPSAPG